MVTTDSVPNLKNLLMAGDRRTPEQQGHRSCRGGVRCRGEGDRAIAGEGKNGGKKRREGKKKGGRVGGGAGQLAIFKTAFSNVWHSAPR
jgi:hypothetical protein